MLRPEGVLQEEGLAGEGQTPEGQGRRQPVTSVSSPVPAGIYTWSPLYKYTDWKPTPDRAPGNVGRAAPQPGSSPLPEGVHTWSPVYRFADWRPTADRMHRWPETTEEVRGPTREPITVCSTPPRHAGRAAPYTPLKQSRAKLEDKESDSGKPGVETDARAVSS